jgi:flagellar basal-body rod protein FlgC
MTLSALGTGLSGMQGYQRALDISANNVANTLSTGYQATQAQFQEASPAGSGVNVSNQAASPSSSTNLTDEMVNQVIYKTGFEASAQVVKVSDQMLGTLVNTLA